MKYFSLLFALLFSLSAFSQPTTRYGLELPAGTILPFAGAACPSGFLKADGTQISRSTYAKLFAAISTAHGTGNGSSTFHLPDYRGLFLRMVDETKGNDPDKTTRTAMNSGGAVGNNVGSVQTDDNKAHTHTGPTYNVLSNSSNNIAAGQAGSVVGTYSVGSSGGTEARPKNAYVLYCIKY